MATGDGGGAADTVRARVSLRGITKRFDEVVANDRVDLDFAAGEVHALLGENGAGKSTLMNILNGLITPDQGVIEIDGDPMPLGSPREALRRGIGMVHQHFQLFDRLTVAENLLIGWSEGTGRFRGPRAVLRRAHELSQRYGFAIDPHASVWQLSLGEKQRLEILRTLVRGTDVLILDEPTAALTPSETEALFKLIREIRERNQTVVFISHKLPEVLAIADRITVMRNGRKVQTLDRREADPTTLTKLMVGGELRRPIREPVEQGEVVLRAEGISAIDDRGLPALTDVSIHVRRGEIVGVAGVAGNGQRELSEALAGLRRIRSGRVLVGDSDLSRAGPRAFIAAGVGYVPEDRLGTGLAPAASIWRNAILKSYWRAPINRHGVVNRSAAADYARELVKAVKLSASDISVPVRTLSGGHAQRLLTGREMDVGRRALVLAYPTRGLDIQAVVNLRLAILDARSQGVATLLFSEELDEILELSDRVLVLYEGRVVGEYDRDSADRTAIAALMSGLRTNGD